MQKTDEAIDDCTKAIELDEKYVKAYLRRAKWYVKLPSCATQHTHTDTHDSVAQCSSRTLVFGWRTFPDLCLTCDHFLGKVSTMGQPTRSTQPSIPLGSVNE